MTDDVARTAKATTEHGGSVEMGPMEVAENGSSAMIKDPGGSIIGAWQPNRQKGFELTGEAGALCVVRAAHGRVRPGGRLLPRGVRLGRPRDERHRRLPVHDPRRG